MMTCDLVDVKLFLVAFVPILYYVEKTFLNEPGINLHVTTADHSRCKAKTLSKSCKKFQPMKSLCLCK